MIKANIFKTILICSNVLLLCTGLTILILGIKLLLALSVLTLTNIPFVQNAVNALIATGVFISLCSLSGLVGGCNESKGLLVGHLIFLGVIVILEFSIGVTLMMIKKSVSTAVESSECNNVCAATFDAAILDYALPSAGLMMSIIFVEALMIYSSIRLYFFIRDKPRTAEISGPSAGGQNVQMQNVAGTEDAFDTESQTAYSSPIEYTFRQPRLDIVFQGSARRSQSNIEDKPPDYHSLAHYPPPYTSEMRYGDSAASTSAVADQPKDTDDSFNPV